MLILTPNDTKNTCFVSEIDTKLTPNERSFNSITMSANVTFKTRLDRIKSDNTASIICCITLNGKRSKFNTELNIQPSKFDNVKGLVKGKSDEAKQINNQLKTIRFRLYELEDDLISKSIEVTSESLKSAYFGLNHKPTKQVTSIVGLSLLKVLDELNSKLCSNTGRNRLADSTLFTHKHAAKLIREFLTTEMKVNDILLKDLKYSFIVNFNDFLLRRMTQPTAVKYVAVLRQIVNISANNELIDRNPFSSFRLSVKRHNPIYLTIDELNTIIGATFKRSALNKARDMFIFGCYTGMAYSDIINLKPEDITLIDGRKWIKKARVKTKVVFTIPILPKADEIMAHYIDNGEWLPYFQIQNLNKYLKEIALQCNINKRLTFHTARHTFATTITLANNIPIEVVSKMLGHSTLQMTSHYARVIDKQILDSMKKLL